MNDKLEELTIDLFKILIQQYPCRQFKQIDADYASSQAIMLARTLLKDLESEKGR